jgi:hypothetical protein
VAGRSGAVRGGRSGAGRPWAALGGPGGAALGGAAGRPAETSADLFRQLDDDPLWAANVAEPIAVFVALHLANELRAVLSQAG